MGLQGNWQPTSVGFGSLDSRFLLLATRFVFPASRSLLPFLSICPWTPVLSLKKILAKDLQI